MNGKTHRAFSAFASGGAAFLLSKNETPENRVIETIGGALVGYPLGTLPDLIEPATSPRHRGPFHSVAFGGVIVAVAAPRVAQVQTAVRGWADQHHRQADASRGLAWLWHQLLALLGRLAAGAVPAVMGTAYLSHLALDSITPAGLPLIHPALA